MRITHEELHMKPALLLAIAAGALIIALLVYRPHFSGNRLQVDPHAREEIEKAKRR